MAISTDELPDTRRIAACLKACEGIPTEKLEDGVLLRLVAACIHLDDAQVREVLEELSPIRPRLVKTRR
jgi:hypothetical protein